VTHVIPNARLQSAATRLHSKDRGEQLAPSVWLLGILSIVICEEGGNRQPERHFLLS
jgi:hypothetical protein